MSDATFLTPEFSGRLCLTLVHSLWQLGLLAIVGWAAERWRGRRSLEWAYGVHVALLAFGVVATAGTFAWVDVKLPLQHAADGAAPANGRLANDDGTVNPAGPRSAAASRLTGGSASPTTPTVLPFAATQSGARNSEFVRAIAENSAPPTWLRFAPIATAFYALGVAAMLVRLGVAMSGARRLQRRATAVEDSRLLALRDALVRRWSMRVAPVLAAASDVAVPMVVGLARPTILLPLAATTNLTVDELELILAHELAHVRRHDMWVNLFQRLVETVLFFNPGAWRLSRRTSVLREYCCDESAADAVAGVANRATSVRTRYAQALLRVAEMHHRHAGGAAALAASGRAPSELRRRIARLFGEPLRDPLPLSRSGAAVVAFVVALMLAGPALRPVAAEPEAGRTLEFPADRAVGVIHQRPATASDFSYGNEYADWKPLGEARGKVTILPDMQVRLDVSQAASADLAFLDALPPDAIDMLLLQDTDVTDAGLAHVGRLTGLRVLDLGSTRITDAGVKHLAGLAHLKQINLDAWDVSKEGFGVGDDALGVAAFLPELEAISLRLTKVTDEGMARLAVRKSLRSVSIPGTAVTDAGLTQLARLPRLEYLRLGVYDEGTAVTDEGMRTVARMVKLKWLDLSATKVDNDGLKNLAPLTNLEWLCVDETQITNDGLAALEQFKRLKFFRGYDLADGSINDRGAAHLAKLPRLETIQANMELSNDGVIAIAKAPRLQQLSLSSPNVNDACCAAIAAMPNLKELWFQDCLITDQGLEQLSRAQRLEYLLINDAAITSEGLRHLKNLPKLVRLSIDMDVQEDRSPDKHPSLRRIGELTGLTDLDVDGFAGSEVKWLAPLKNLTHLELGWRFPIDDQGCAIIGGMPKLERLTIHASMATDAGLTSLGALASLRYLSISCLATDQGLPALYGLKSLWRTQIASPHVTQAGLDRLAENVPSLQHINTYVYRLDNTDVTPSTKDAFFRRGAPETRAERHALEDHPPPAMTVDWRFNVGDGEDDRDLMLADLRGKVVLVHFWGARISSSQKVQPEIQALYDKFADQGLEIVGVHMTDYAESLDAFVAHHKVGWPVGLDLKDQTDSDWKVDVVGDYLIDRSGTLRYADIFHPHLESAVQTLLAEPAPEALETPPSPQAAEEAADDPPGNEVPAGKFAIEVRPTTPDGQPVHNAYITLWRELADGEPVTGKEFVWHEPESGSLWIRAGYAHPNDGRHSYEESTVRFSFADLPPGRYRVTAMSYHPKANTPDPTPYGLSRAVLLGVGPGAAPKQPTVLDVALGGSRRLTVTVLDEHTQQPIEAIAIRLRDSHGMPIIHGHGSGNFFERTGAEGRVAYRRLNPGVYTIDILGKPPRVNDFIEYKQLIDSVHITLERDAPSTITIKIPPHRLTDEEIAKSFKFSVYGRVTDDKGQPLPGVEVRAATGMGTLTGGGRVTTDADGRYKLHFGPGVHMMDDSAPLGVGTQAASIFASKEGWFETNLCRQGDLLMTDQDPEAARQAAEGWGGKTLNQVVFPNKPVEVNFTLARSAVLEGKLVSNGSRELEDVQLTLDGDELPPASSVLAQVTTGEDGEFRIDAVPLGQKWRFVMRIGPTWDEIETEPFELTLPGVTRCEVSLNTVRTATGAVTASLDVRMLDEQDPAAAR